MNALRAAGLALLVLGTMPVPGMAGTTILEQKIAALNPCAGLKGDVGGLSIRVDRLGALRIDDITLSLHGTALNATLRGALSCRASNASLLQGDVGADIAISATLSVPECQPARLDVALSNIGGAFGPVLEALRGEAEDALRGSVQGALVDACHALVKSLGP
jgi:hypothetical protein